MLSSSGRGPKRWPLPWMNLLKISGQGDKKSVTLTSAKNKLPVNKLAGFARCLECSSREAVLFWICSYKNALKVIFSDCKCSYYLINAFQFKNMHTVQLDCELIIYSSSLLS